MDSSSPLLSLVILLTFSCIPPLYADPSVRSSTPIPSPSPLPPRPSIVVMITILISLSGIIFILLLYVKHCAHGGGTPGGYPGNLPATAVGRKNSGIDRAVVESLPIFRFASLRGKKDGLECAVCLERFEPTETLRLLPKCGHAFHVECIDTWLDAHSTCPLCRYRVDPEDILIPGGDIIIRAGNDDLERDASISASASVSASVSAAVAGRTQQVSGRHSFAGERARGFGDSIRSVFNFRRSLDGNVAAMSRKDGLLRTAADGEVERLRQKMRADRKVEHRIVVSDGKGVNERWSDIQPSDLLYLESRTMTSNARSASAMAGIGRNYGWVGEGPPPPPPATRSRSSTGD